MSVKILCVGDLHFKLNNINETDELSIKILSFLEKNKFDFVVFLGDILDRHSNIDMSPLCRITHFFEKVSKIVKIFILVGNHDMKNNREFLPKEHSLVIFKYWNNLNITIVDKIVEYRTNDFIFIFSPYIPNGRFVEALDINQNWKNAKCIFAHQEFKGCNMGAIISENGDEWDLNNPLVISGHIHDYQRPQKNIYYTGTPYQTSYSDSSKKCISSFEFNENNYTCEKIKLNLRGKKIIKLLIGEVENYIPELNYDLKIIIKGTNEEIKNIMKHPNVIQWKKEGHKVISKNDLEKENVKNKKEINYEMKKYSTELYDSIKHDKELKQMYEEIFN